MLHWAREIGEPQDLCDSVAPLVRSRPDGGLIVAGIIWGDVVFGEGEPQEITLTSDGGEAGDVYLASYTGDGEHLAWARRGGGAEYDEVGGIEVLDDGSIILVGWFEGEASFDDGDTGELLVEAVVGENAFLVKYDSVGEIDWFRRLPGSEECLEKDWECESRAYDIVALSDGSILVAGELRFSIVFGEDEPNETILSASPNGLPDCFLAKFDEDGSLIWVKSGTGSGWNSAKEVAPLDDGSSILAGTFTGNVVFGQDEANETTLSEPTGLDQIFIAKYFADGTVAWAIQAGGEADEYVDGLTVVDSEEVYLSGSFSGAAVFGEGEPNETTLTATGITDIFVAKYLLTD
jgi:hypothetical protein